MDLIDLIKASNTVEAVVPAADSAKAHRHIMRQLLNKVMPWMSGRKPMPRKTASSAPAGPAVPPEKNKHRRLAYLAARRASPGPAKTASLNYGSLGGGSGGGSRSQFYTQLGNNPRLQTDPKGYGQDIFNQISQQAIDTYRGPSAFESSFPSLIDRLRKRTSSVPGNQASRGSRGFWGRLFTGDFSGAHDLAIGNWQRAGRVSGGGYSSNPLPTGRQLAGAVGEGAAVTAALPGGIAARYAVPSALGEIGGLYTGADVPDPLQTAALTLTSPFANAQDRQLAREKQIYDTHRYANALGRTRAQRDYPQDYAEYVKQSPSELSDIEMRLRARGEIR